MTRLAQGETMRNDLRCAMFWPTIGNGVYISTTVASQIRDPRVRLVHRCITYTLSGRHSSHHHVTSADLFYLYTIYSAEAFCNIPFWVANFLNSGVVEREGDRIYGGMLVTRLARSYGILGHEIMRYLGSDSACRVVKVRSLKQMEVVMEMEDGTFIWFNVGGNVDPGSDEDEDEPQQQHPHGGYEAGTADYYWHMSPGDWQAHQGVWIGEVDAWRSRVDERFE